MKTRKTKGQLYRHQEAIRKQDRKINNYLMAKSKKMFHMDDDKGNPQNHYHNMRKAYNDLGLKGVRLYEKEYRRAIKRSLWKARLLRIAVALRLVKFVKESTPQEATK